MGNLQNSETSKLVLFNLDELRYALNLSTVERVIPIVEITPLPKAPEIVLGVINIQGEIIPVINIRKHFNLPVREIELDNQLIIVHASKRRVAIVVDSVTGVHELERYQFAGTEEAFPYTEYLSGIAKVENNIVMILDEQKVMDEALYTGEK
jgi:purine-binding chemotaxis protein CheW